MTEIIAALQEEIAVAQKKHDRIRPFTWQNAGLADDYLSLCGYIKGLETAVDLMTKEAVPFTAENGDCSFMENGDLR